MNPLAIVQSLCLRLFGCGRKRALMIARDSLALPECDAEVLDRLPIGVRPYGLPKLDAPCWFVYVHRHPPGSHVGSGAALVILRRSDGHIVWSGPPGDE